MHALKMVIRLSFVAAGLVVLGASSASARPYDTSGSASATVSPKSGKAATVVEITGTGFRPNTAVTVTFDGVMLDGAGGTAASTGDVTVSATVPAEASGGVHVFALQGEDAQGRLVELTGPFRVVGAGKPRTMGSAPVVTAAVVTPAALLLVTRGRRRTVPVIEP